MAGTEGEVGRLSSKAAAAVRNSISVVVLLPICVIAIGAKPYGENSTCPNGEEAELEKFWLVTAVQVYCCRRLGARKDYNINYITIVVKEARD